MAKTDFKNMDEYIAPFPKEVRRILKQVRRTIKGAVPGADEVISYQIPAFKFHGWVFYLAAHKNHYSLLCPPPFTVFKAFKKELSPYQLSTSAIRFPLDRPVPVTLIRNMAKYRAKENLKRDKAKAKKEG